MELRISSVSKPLLTQARNQRLQRLRAQMLGVPGGAPRNQKPLQIHH